MTTRVFDPLKPDHPVIGDRCGVCQRSFCADGGCFQTNSNVKQVQVIASWCHTASCGDSLRQLTSVEPDSTRFVARSPFPRNRSE